MGPEALGADKLAHSYSVTAHRSQGQTVDVTYALEDGGGRELAYLAMSRARGESHLYVVGPSVAEAAQRLAWAWGQERRQAWILDHDPATGWPSCTGSARNCAAPYLPTARPTSSVHGTSWGPWDRTEPTCTPAPGAGPALPPATPPPPYAGWRPSTSTPRSW